MRVIAGKYKRRVLQTVAGQDRVRPTTDRVKENIFNLLGQDLQGLVVWDLFAGSGALGIEALSRGARKAYFVEAAAEAVSCIHKNRESLGIPAQDMVVVKQSVELFLEGVRGGEDAVVSFQKHAETRSEERRVHNAVGGTQATQRRSIGMFLETHVDVILADPPYASGWYDTALLQLERSGVCAPGSRLVLEMDKGREILVPAGSCWAQEDVRIYGATKIEIWRRAWGVQGG